MSVIFSPKGVPEVWPTCKSFKSFKSLISFFFPFFFFVRFFFEKKKCF